MRVLISGGAGFVGSHLAEHLVASGHHVAVVDNLSTGQRQNLPPDVELIVQDIRSPLHQVFARLRPEVVYHLAAQVSVPNSMKDPGTDLAVNVTGTINVLDAASRVGARKIVSVSSAAVYGEPLGLPISEEHSTTPLSPYGLSKLTGERYIRLLAPTMGLSYTIIRPANIYGPRQLSDGEGAVIPAFLTRFLSGVDPVIHGDGSQTRDFIYVTDMVTALTHAATRGDEQTLNVSTATRVSVVELWEKIARLVDWKRPPSFGSPRPGDIPHSVMNNDLARTQLDWAPAISLVEGLTVTVAWEFRRQAAASRQE